MESRTNQGPIKDPQYTSTKMADNDGGCHHHKDTGSIQNIELHQVIGSTNGQKCLESIDSSHANCNKDDTSAVSTMASVVKNGDNTISDNKLRDDNGNGRQIKRPAPKFKKWRLIKNVLVLGAGFVLLFGSYTSTANLQTSLNKEEGVGAIGQATVYASVMVSSLLLPDLVITKLGCKWTLPICMTGYIAYIASNFYAVKAVMIPASIWLGLGAACLWSAQSVYLTQIAVWYAQVTRQSKTDVISFFFGLFFLFVQFGQIWGNLVSSLIFAPDKDFDLDLCNSTNCFNLTTPANSTMSSINDSMSMHPNVYVPTDSTNYSAIDILTTNYSTIDLVTTNYSTIDLITNNFSTIDLVTSNYSTIDLVTTAYSTIDIFTTNTSVNTKTCGAYFCPEDALTADNSDNFDQPLRKVYMVCGTYAMCGICGASILALFLDNIVLDKEETNKGRKFTPQRITSTFRHLMTSRIQLLLIPITMYDGMEKAFISGDFTKAYVSCSLGIWNLGYCMLTYGVSSGVCSFLFGRLVRYIGHVPFFLLTFLLHGGVLIGLLLWQPHPDHFPVFFIISALWGVGDSVVTSQVFALYSRIFTENSEAAFASFKLFESLGFVISFSYNNILCMVYKIYIMMVVLLLAFLCYTGAEIMHRRQQRRIVVVES